MGATSSFPYDTENPVHTPSNSIWEIYTGFRKEDSAKVTIFKFDKQKHSSTQLSQANNFIKRLKTLKHPNVLIYIDSIDLPEHLFVVTERALPLSHSFNPMKGLSQSPEECALGLFQLSKALSFVSNDCKLVHGSLSLDSVFVTESSDWKLAGFQDTHPLDNYSRYGPTLESIPTRYLSPESSSLRTPDTSSSIWAFDAWCLACLIYEIFSGELSSPQQLTKLHSIPQPLHPEYKRLLATKPGSRMNPQQVSESQFFQTQLVQAIDFLDHISLKSAGQKETFFKQLADSLEQFPVATKKYKILPLLVNALKFGSASAKVLSSVLMISRELESDEFQRVIVPLITELFSSNERSIRVSLLKNMSYYIHHLDQALVNNTIFPHIKTGFTDQTSVLREWTVKSLVYLIPKLKDKTRETQVFPYLPKLQQDPEAAIRTNTAVVVGKFAKYLNPSQQSKVLLGVFGRSLRDPFVPARRSGISALKATSDLYSMKDIAGKVVPLLSIHTIDPSKEVRSLAFSALDLFISRLGENSASIPDQEKEDVVEEPAKNSINGVMDHVSSWTSSFTGPASVATKESLPEPVKSPADKLVSTSRGVRAGMSLASTDKEDVGGGWDDFNDLLDIHTSHDQPADEDDEDLLNFNLLTANTSTTTTTTSKPLASKALANTTTLKTKKKTIVKTNLSRAVKKTTTTKSSSKLEAKPLADGGWEDFLNN